MEEEKLKKKSQAILEVGNAKRGKKKKKKIREKGRERERKNAHSQALHAVCSKDVILGQYQKEEGKKTKKKKIPPKNKKKKKKRAVGKSKSLSQKGK